MDVFVNNVKPARAGRQSRFALILLGFLLLLSFTLPTKADAATLRQRYVNTASVGGDGTTNEISGANAAYASLSAAVIAEATNLVTADVYLVINASGVATDTTAVNITGFTTDSTHYVKIVGDNDTGKASAIHYRLGGMTLVNGSSVLGIVNNYTQIYNIEITNFKGTAEGNLVSAISVSGRNSIIDGCIIHDNSTLIESHVRGIGIGVSSANPDGVIIRNNLIYNFRGVTYDHKYGIYSVYNYGAKIHNNTLYNIIGPGSYAGYGIYNQGAGGTNYPILINNISYNNKTADFFGLFSASSTNNLSKDTTASTTYGTYYMSKTLSFVSTTTGSEDLHLASTDTDAIDKGADLSAIFTTDIDGQIRPYNSIWDIGADEYWLSYDINSSAGPNGSISPTSTTSVVIGANQTFTITPNGGYYIATLTVDGGSVATSTSYTFTNVTADHTISATFEAIPNTHVITSSAGANGSISPLGATAVTDGDSQSYTITPSAGCDVATLLIDGSPIATSTSYDFTNVTADHTIAVTFADITKPATVTGLTASTTSSSAINLSWNSSTDNIAVTGYIIYRNDIQVATTSSATYSNTGLAPSTLYSYTVSAYDATNNISASSSSATATTDATKTYYMATTGNDTTGDGSMGNPFLTLHKSFQVMHGGDTLIIEDGTYTGSSNVINIQHHPPSGSLQNWTIIKAEHDGSVTFDGQNTQGMLGLDYGGTLTDMYMQFEGLFWKDAGSIGVSYGKYFKFLRCGNSDNSQGNSASFYGGNSSYGLFENCYSYGSGRYKFLVYDSDNMIVRSCVARTDWVNAPNEPLGMFSMYGAHNVEIQNSIGIDSDQDSHYIYGGELVGSMGNPTSGAADRSTISNFTNVISLNNHISGGSTGGEHGYVSSYNNSVWWDFTNMNSGNNLFNIRSATTTFNNVLIGNAHNYGTGQGITYYDAISGDVLNSIIYGFVGSGASLYSRMAMTHDYNSFYGNTHNFDGTSAAPHEKTTTNPIYNSLTNPTGALKYITQIEPGSNLSGQGQGGADIGANIKTLVGTPGTLWGETGYNVDTGVSMWPFPNEDLIKSKMSAYSFTNATGTVNGARGFAAPGTGLYGGPLTLTSYIWEYLGNVCPEDICNYSIITATAGANGTITPLGATTTINGNSQTYTITSDSGYTVSTLLIDGSPVSTSTSYTFTNVTTDHTIAATFSLIPTPSTRRRTSSVQSDTTTPITQTTTNTTSANGTTQTTTPTEQIATTTSTVTTPTSTTSSTFMRDLFYGIEGIDVKELQDILISEGYLAKGKNTGYFGYLTQTALVKYQKAKAIIPAVGYFGPKTRALFGTSTPIQPIQGTHSLLTKVLVLGMTDPEVTILQQILKTLPDIYPEGIVSGYFGNLTLKAVKKFQLEYNIVSKPTDIGYGVVGPATRAKLNQM